MWDEDEDLVAVVIPARNEESFIGSCLDSVLAQSYDRLDILVADGGSDDRTREIVQRYADRDRRVRLVDNPGRIVPTGLNAAVSRTDAPWLVRIDAHSTVPPDYVATAVGHLRTGRWGGVGGRKDGIGETVAGSAVAAVMGSRFGVGNSVYHYGTETQTVDHIPFGAYPVDVIRELDGWDEELVTNQDFEFDQRVRRSGRELLFDPSLVIHWHCRQSITDLFRQYQRYGKGKARVALLHPRSVSYRHLAAPALVAWLALAVLVALRRPRVAAAMAGPYVAANAAASVLTVQRVSEPAARTLVPAGFAAMHVGWGIGFWQGLFGIAARRAGNRADTAVRSDTAGGISE